MNTALVCANAPPGNADAGLANRRREKLIDVPGVYHGHDLAQANNVWAGWCREASRLFAEYWRTANAKHLGAFAAHVHGMRTHDGRRK
jgi:hypothetical protein